MAHKLVKSGYSAMVDRLNMLPQGAAPSETLFKILQVLLDENEARLVSLLPIKPFTVIQAANRWGMDSSEAHKILDSLADRAILLDAELNGEMQYTLPPPMAGFFEFSMMRIRGDIDQKALGELFFQYLNVEDDFIRNLFSGGDTQLGRAYVNETAIPPESNLQVLDYERASAVIQTASDRAIGLCYCRHKMQHLDRACNAPMDICMTFNSCANSLIRHGFARSVDVKEGLDLLQQAYGHNLVQFGENVREGVSFICNCCGCCCEALIAQRKFGILHPIHTTNFIPVVNYSNCTGCGKCVSACPVEAMVLVSANESHSPNKKKAKLDANLCLGCGVCVRNCPNKGLELQARSERVITPINSVHRTVVMAIERGQLQNLIFDNRALWNHRAMAAILGVILQLPPIKQIMASRQVKSHYLEALIQRIKI